MNSDLPQDPITVQQIASNQTNHRTEAKSEILSRQIIKPSSPTSPSLRDYKLSFLDQIVSHYVPMILFYSADDITGSSLGFSSISSKLKASLSDMLSLYYPFCGRLKRNACVECNDAGVLYMEARIPSTLAEILEYPQLKVLKQFLPIDIHESPQAGYTDNNEEPEPVLMAVQVTELSCGAVGIGVCILHKVADGTTAVSFLKAWGETARASGGNAITKPHMEAGLLFPTRDNFFSPLLSSSSKYYKEKIGLMRLVFDGTSLSSLKAEMEGFNPTRVEAATALVWKSMMEAAARGNSGDPDRNLVGTFATHAVNIRGRMFPPLPEHSMGNIIQFAVTELVDFQADRTVEIRDLAAMVRKAIKKFDAEYMGTLLSDDGFDVVMERLNHVIGTSSKGGARWYSFTSWAGFPLYQVDFGWGKPTWVCSICIHKPNYIMLLPTRDGEGMEAWVSLIEKDMVEFKHNPRILRYASVSVLSS